MIPTAEEFRVTLRAWMQGAEHASPWRAARFQAPAPIVSDAPGAEGRPTLPSTWRRQPPLMPRGPPPTLFWITKKVVSRRSATGCRIDAFAPIPDLPSLATDVAGSHRPWAIHLGNAG